MQADVRLMQTHISYVLLAGEFAYKIKKPLNLSFLDYTTLEQRRRMCDEEVRLNRRLCSGVYLGVVPVLRNSGGRHVLFGEGEVVEYAVQMRRVPSDQSMPSLLEEGAVDRGRLMALASKVAAFHRAADTNARIAAYGRGAAVRANWDENFDQVLPFIGETITPDEFAATRAYVHGFLAQHAALIEERADEGRVRDGHGDLRTDSVVFAPDGSLCIMDCIEFSERLRCGDVASDAAFLAMDLEFRGHRREADEFLSFYIEALGDDATLTVMLGFYRAYRAFVRGKVDSILSVEQEVPAAERAEARRRAKGYFERSAFIAEARVPQSMIAMVGLSGTGKSFVARAIAARCGAVLLSSDAIRRESGSSPGRAAYGEGGYTAAQRERVYARMFEEASKHLSRQRSIVLDATFLTRAQRDSAREISLSSGVPLVFMHTVAPDEMVRERLAARMAAADTSDARWDTYLAQQERFDPLDDVDSQRLLTLDSMRPLNELVDQAAAAITRSL
jgi:aminoglycoside phosphotransferase family enzyme/predicted kinase